MTSPNNHVVCIYHDHCLDGIAAAWVVWRHFKNLGLEITLIPGVYNKPLPEGLAGKTVFVVDFSFDREKTEWLIENTNLVLLDHHKSAKKALQGLCEVDLTYSGAMLAWRYFNPNTPAPEAIRYVEDNDLWKFTYPSTKAWVTAAFSYPLTVEIFDSLVNRDPLDMVAEGETLLRKQRQDIKRILHNTRTMIVFGMEVPVINANIMFTSDLGDALYHVYPLVVIYSDQADGRKFSFRSKKVTGYPVNEIAEYFGGGGHGEAASFTLPFSDKRFAKSHMMLNRSIWDCVKLYFKNLF